MKRIVIGILLVIVVISSAALFWVTDFSSDKDSMIVHNRHDEELILEDEEASRLRTIIASAVVDEKHMERPKYVYSNKVIFYDEQGKHYIDFTAPSLVLSDDEGVIIYDGKDIEINMEFYLILSSISEGSDFILEVD